MYRNKSSNTLAKGKKQVSRKKLILFVLLGLIVLFGILFVLDRKDILNLPFFPDNQATTSPTGINYDPPTKQEKIETEEFKENLGNQSKDDAPTPTPAPTTSTGKKSVTPIITSSTGTLDIEVRGFVPGVIEEGGTCTLTIAKDGQTVTESKAATPDVTKVNCVVSIARARVSPGTWTATLSYTSASSEGVSTSNQIEVK